MLTAVEVNVKAPFSLASTIITAEMGATQTLLYAQLVPRNTGSDFTGLERIKSRMKMGHAGWDLKPEHWNAPHKLYPLHYVQSYF